MSKEFIAHRRKSDGRPQALHTHLSEVGELAAGFTKKINLPESGRLLGLLHDFGKYSQAFQNYIASATGDIDQDDENWVDSDKLKGKIDHSSAGAQYIWERFKGAGEFEQGSLVGQVLALCIASHHNRSGLIDCISIKGDPKFKQRMDKPKERTHLGECKQNADAALLKSVDHLATSKLCMNIFKSLLSVTSGQSLLSKIDWFNLGFFARFLFSALVDADCLNSAEFETPSRQKERLQRHRYFNWDVAVKRVELFITDELKPHRKIDYLRQEISENCLQKSRGKQGIYTFTVPTGGGKTYASLRYAVNHAAQHKLDRIIYIVPYTSIIEQNAAAIRKAVEREGDPFPWVLEQHSNLEPEQQTWRSKLIAENWDSPIVLTTMVQFLGACFAGEKRSGRRLHQLANSVIIFDEIQTLPIKCVHLFCNALNFLSTYCSTTALLCTATQPLLNELKNKAKGRLEIPIENEIMNNVAHQFEQLNRVDVVNQIRSKGWQVDEVAELALTQFNKAGSCLNIVNTKNWAQQLYQYCEDHVPNTALYHLSTNQCPAHRKQLLNEIRTRLDNNSPVLCFSTQLIEAGVDVSFARVIRFLAGLDSIAQAAGRCNRHGEATDEKGNPIKGQVLIINPAKETTGLLTDIEEGKKAVLRVLGEGFENLVAPDAVSQYFKYYFHERADDMDYRLDKAKIGRSDSLLNLLSDNQESPSTYIHRWEKEHRMPLLSQSFTEASKQFKAIDAPTQAVIVPFGEGKEIISELCGVNAEFDPKKYYELHRRSQKYSVNVFPNTWEKLKKAGAVHEAQPELGIYHLDERYYNDDFGLSDEPVALMEDYSI